MQAVWVALIAVVGTLSGSLLTGWLQHRQAARLDAAARSERARQERITSYRVFAHALVAYRRWMIHRGWALYAPGATESLPAEVAAAVHEARTAARAALLELLLLPPVPEVAQAARAGLEATTAIEEAEDLADVQVRAEAARQAAETFVATAADHT